jgi:hypothetical protein
MVCARLGYRNEATTENVLLNGDIAAKFFTGVLNLPQVRGLLGRCRLFGTTRTKGID